MPSTDQMYLVVLSEFHHLTDRSQSFGPPSQKLRQLMYIEISRRFLGKTKEDSLTLRYCRVLLLRIGALAESAPRSPVD